MKFVEAQDLKPGDDIGFGRVITQVFNSGLTIPTNKTEVIYTQKGEVKKILFGKNTKIRINCF